MWRVEELRCFFMALAGLWKEAMARDRIHGLSTNVMTRWLIFSWIVSFSTSFTSASSYQALKMADNWCTIESDPGTLGLLRFANSV
jgi:ABC-type uncharacterized transport system permease subunit